MSCPALARQEAFHFCVVGVAAPFALGSCTRLSSISGSNGSGQGPIRQRDSGTDWDMSRHVTPGRNGLSRPAPPRPAPPSHLARLSNENGAFSLTYCRRQWRDRADVASACGSRARNRRTACCRRKCLRRRAEKARRPNATRRLSSGAVGRVGGETLTVGINAAADARR